ncbi:outer membrane beta-barrel protein [Pedobacter sp. MW01-1-1]|uniref:outer membrane beta-barrel protein n=1 Tax=Pedobacter sp. MW01-1-1 TaxID=3383027 RepID=UPI003FF0C034
MKRIFTKTNFNLYKLLASVLIMVCFGSTLYAQNQPKKTTPPPIPLREVSGIIKDDSKLGVPGVTIRLTSAHDTLTTVTNDDGIFVLKKVKDATYTLAASSLGYKTFVGKFKQNDVTPRIIMDPIFLKNDSKTLNEVTINGTPSITYKTDTVEYKASDYVVRENATVDELLKKMEGMEVGSDGSLTHQGNAIAKAKINGKVYLGGDVSSAIQNLPAEIVDKIQIVDDYGDEAARTGVKDGDPEKILNIVTRTDKSVGNTLRVGAGVGNNNRYDGSIFASRLNQDQVIGVNARANNTITGVANSGGDSGGGGNGGRGGGNRGGGNGGGGNSSSGGSGGTATSIGPSFSYRDQLGKKIKINTNYSFNYNNNKSSNLSESFSPTVPYNTYTSSESLRNSTSRSHNFSFEFEDDIDSANFLRISPRITLSDSYNSSISKTIQTIKTRQDRNGESRSTSSRPNINATVFYQHIFKKPRRNLSFQLTFGNSESDATSEQNNRILYYDTLNVATKDSLVHRLIERKNMTSNYRGSFTYVEPLTLNTQIEFNAQLNYNGYDNKALTSNINAGGVEQLVDSLSNIYEYSFTQSRIALNYRSGLNSDSKVRFSAGLTAVPAILQGTKASLGTTTQRKSFNLIPIARFQYLWSKQHSVQLNYSGNANEPSFDQIQPVRDESNPQNPVVGNPDLKVAFSHSINTSYNNYIANLKLNYSINGNATFVQNKVVTNRVVIAGPYDSQLNETHYVNIDGNYNVNGNYSINKQLNDRKYNLAFRGNFSYNHGVSMNNNISYETNTWVFYEKFGPRITPNDWMEVNPSASFNFTKSASTLSTNAKTDNKTKTTALNLDGKFYFLKGFEFGYSASKNFVTGINANITSNPFVVNCSLQRDFWHRRISTTIQVFDILNQNNFVNRDTNVDGSYTDTKSNALSRYFMFRVSANLQKWTGAKGRNGAPIRRRGDGSFMN